MQPNSSAPVDGPRRSSSTSSLQQQQRRRYLASLVGNTAAAPPSTPSSAINGNAVQIIGNALSGSDHIAHHPAGVAPFSVSVSYTIPKRSRSSGPSSASASLRGAGAGTTHCSSNDADGPSRSSWTGADTSIVEPDVAIHTLASDRSISHPTHQASHQAPHSTNAHSLTPPPQPHQQRVPQPPPRRARNHNPQSLEHAAALSRKSALQLNECIYDGNEDSFLALLMDRLRSQVVMVAGSEYATTDDQQYLLAQEQQQQREEQRTLWEVVESRNRPSLLKRIPMELMLAICEYSNVVDLCRLSGVSRRVATVLQSPLVWIRHCKRYRLPLQQKQMSLEFVIHPRKVVVDYLILARRTLDEHLAQEQQTLHALEERLNARAAEVAPFSTTFLSEHQSSSSAHSSREDLSAAPRRLVQLIQQSEAQLTEMVATMKGWDAARGEMQRLLQTNRDTLRKQQVDLKRIQRSLLPNHPHPSTTAVVEVPHKVAPAHVSEEHGTGHHGGRSLVPKELLRTYGSSNSETTTSKGSGGSAPSSAAGIRRLTAGSIEQFERKMVRVVLSAARDLPVIIRRGTSTFGAMELLSLQLAGSPSPVASLVAQRWKTMKQFFPLTSNDYGNLCDLLLAPAPPARDGEDSDNSEHADAAVAIPQALTSCAALVRRVLVMSDEELIECAGL